MSITATIAIPQPDGAARRKSILLVFACTILGAAAQLLIKTGMNHFSPHWMALATNLPLIAGYALLGINTLMMVLALKDGEMSLLYPIIALTYVWTTLLRYNLRAEPSTQLTALHEAGQRAWGLAPGPPYRPHLSLLYARDLPGERKPAIADGLGLALPVTIRVDAAEIWADFRDEVTRWRRVARVPLAG